MVYITDIEGMLTILLMVIYGTLVMLLVVNPVECSRKVERTTHEIHRWFIVRLSLIAR